MKMNKDKTKVNKTAGILRLIPSFMRKRSFGYSMLTVDVLFILWIVLTSTGIADELFLPGPLKVWQAFITVATEGYQGSLSLIHI